MVSTPDSIEQLGAALHNNPAAYWCPQCGNFTLDCNHLVPPLTTRLVPVKDWLLGVVEVEKAWGLRKISVALPLIERKHG